MLGAVQQQLAQRRAAFGQGECLFLLHDALPDLFQLLQLLDVPLVFLQLPVEGVALCIQLREGLKILQRLCKDRLMLLQLELCLLQLRILLLALPAAVLKQGVGGQDGSGGFEAAQLLL